MVREKVTKLALYICKDIQCLYFSRATCIDVGIQHGNFPNPLADKYKEVGPKPNKCEDQLPSHPQNPPFPATEENTGKVKSWLLEIWPRRHSIKMGYSQPCSALLPIFTSKRGQFLKSGINPIPLPFHFKAPTLWKVVERGILALVSMGMPIN